MKISRFTIVLIEHNKTMQDPTARFTDFRLYLNVGEEQAKVRELEKQYNMRCCVLVNEDDLK